MAFGTLSSGRASSGLPSWRLRTGSWSLRTPGEFTLVPRSSNATDLNSDAVARSEEHTSELQSLTNLVCRLLLEKKKKNKNKTTYKTKKNKNNKNRDKY